MSNFVYKGTSINSLFEMKKLRKTMGTSSSGDDSEESKSRYRTGNSFQEESKEPLLNTDVRYVFCDYIFTMFSLQLIQLVYCGR